MNSSQVNSVPSAVTSRLAFAIALCLIVVLSSVGMLGQAISGNLVGSVVDSSGAVVSGAEVSALKIDTGIVTTFKTNSVGEYRFENLPAGPYRITVKAAGFSEVTQVVDVVLNKIGTVNVTLTPGAANQVVEVSGTAATIDTSTAQIESAYSDKMASDLPITSAGGNGAGVLNLSMLNPGVTNSSAMGLGVGPSVGGQRPRDNNFMVEGVDNNNKSVTGALIVVPNDAVQDFTLLSNQFNAEYGHSSGGQFNTTVKSGTNDYHGSLYEYFRNRNMNALDNYWVLQGNTTNPPYDNNRYGGTFGGPILKNKLFFFTDFERQRVGLTGSSGLPLESPTAAGLAAIATDNTLSATNFGIFKQYMPVAPAGDACVQYDNQPRPGEPNQVGSYVAPANGNCAAGTVQVGTVPVNAPAFQTFQNYVQSVDYDISTKDQVRGRFIWDKESELDANASLPAFFLPQPFSWYLFTLGEYHTFTPSILNEFRVGFNRYANVLPAGNFKFPGLDAFPNVLLNDLGGVNIGPDSNAPQYTVQNLYQGVDNVSWTKGKHSFKFGFEWREYISPQFFTQRSRGDYEYNSAQMFLEDFSPDIIGERSAGSTTYYGNDKSIYWYANDSWRITPHLTINGGVRYEYTTTPVGEDRQALNNVASQPQIIVPGVNEPLLFTKIAAPKNNYAPRLGLAYSPGNSGNTSIRAGFGMAYDTLYDNIGILGVPAEVGATNDVPDLTVGTANFLKSGGLGGGGTGISVLSHDEAISETSAWIPPQTKDPYSINWNFGVQHSFGKNFVADVSYVGTRGVHLDAQNRINKRALVSPSAFLPTYLQAPSQATLDALPNTLTSLKAPGSLIPAYTVPATDPGHTSPTVSFANSITADLPIGSSSYNGLQTQLSRHFSNGLLFQFAYTYSRDIDNDTADFFSTSLTPRRAQDFQNFAAERSVSPLSRTHRLTLVAVYELPFFKGDSNWLMKNVVGNWGFSPIYTYESPEFADVQSAIDANLNGDSAGDRAVFNPAGKPGTGSGIITLKNSGGAVVAYQAMNPNAEYIRAGAGALANVGRNTLPTSPTNDFDIAVYKDLNFSERFKFRFGAQFANLLNHPQYIPGNNPGSNLGVNDVSSFNSISGGYLNYLTPGNAAFNNPKTVFGSASRTIGLVGKFTF